MFYVLALRTGKPPRGRTRPRASAVAGAGGKSKLLSAPAAPLRRTLDLSADSLATRQANAVECGNCGHRYDPNKTHWRCPECGWKDSCCDNP